MSCFRPTFTHLHGWCFESQRAPMGRDGICRQVRWVDCVNSGAIYSTRPWKVAGEGPIQNSGAAPYGATPRSVAGDIPFTTKGDSLYAIALAWPEDRKLVIKSLASGSPQYRGEITRVGLLGSELNLVWSRTAEGLTVNLLEKPPCDYAYVLKINPSGA